MKAIRIQSSALLSCSFDALACAQDLSKYRQFALERACPKLLEHTQQKMADVKVVHLRPVLIQELNLVAMNLPGASFKSDTVRTDSIFSSTTSELYKDFRDLRSNLHGRNSPPTTW